MKSTTPILVVFSVFFALAIPSCKAPSAPVESGRFVEMVKQPDVGLRLDLTEGVVASPIMNYPLVRVKAIILSGDMKILDDLGLSPAPLQSLSAESEKALLKAAESKENIKIVAAPTVVANLGQKLSVCIVQKGAYIKDVELVPPKDGSDHYTLEPVVGSLSTGFALELVPTIEKRGTEGATVAIRDARVDLVRKLGFRHCVADFANWSAHAVIPWEEPVLLIGELHEKIPAVIEISEGKTILMRMQFHVEQGCANARALALGNLVRETYRPSEECAAGGRSPLGDDGLVLIHSSIIESEEELHEKRGGQ